MCIKGVGWVCCRKPRTTVWTWVVKPALNRVVPVIVLAYGEATGHTLIFYGFGEYAIKLASVMYLPIYRCTKYVYKYV